ncbi:CD99 antigen-like [Phyllobates terribilis]|uniref:CD99 antigen-like n=1 Tax=Phyllobates terribilis TaxID=111132 RepID=UPI003CCB28AD
MAYHKIAINKEVVANPFNYTVGRRLYYMLTNLRANFDLSEALGPDEVKPTSKPQPGPGPGPGDGALDELDGLGFGDTGGASDVPKKPTTKPPSVVHGGGGDDDGFSLEDAIGKDDTHKPTMKPQPGQGGGGGGGGAFGDDDLSEPGMHHDNPSDHDNNPKGRALQPSAGGEEPGQEGNQSMLAGIVSTVAVAAVGAVSSFIAYQKKKLCFKGAAADDPENVNMDSHKGDQSEPQVQSTLLAK